MAKGPKPRSLVDRFWEKVIVCKDCWGWKGYDNGDGYGTLSVHRRSEGLHYTVYAHRLSWEIHKGIIPEGLWVLHKCDNPACTNLDNMQDCARKGRQNGPAKSHPGSLNGFSKLTDDQVREIRASSLSGAELARRLGVVRSLISAIRKRRAWKHVE